MEPHEGGPMEPNIDNNMEQVTSMDIDMDTDKHTTEDLIAAEVLLGLQQPKDRRFISRVSSIPIVTQSLHQLSHVYEASKKYSTIVKYSAETVEQGLSSLPHMNFEPLDRFACTQLDRLEKKFPGYISTNIKEKEKEVLQICFAPTTSTHQIQSYASNQLPQHQQNSNEQQPNTNERSKWSFQAVGSNLGQMVINEDMIRLLKYCLNLLNAATHHIDTQITLLLTHLDQISRVVGGYVKRNILGSHALRGYDIPNHANVPGDLNSMNTGNVNGMNDHQLTRTTQKDLHTYLSQMKQDIANTLRRMVDLIGTQQKIHINEKVNTRIRAYLETRRAE